MSNARKNTRERMNAHASPRHARLSDSGFTLLPLVVAVVALACTVLLARNIEARRAAQARQNVDATAEELYLTGERVRQIVPGALRPVVADWYWMRTLQYVGNKSIAYNGALSLDDLRPLNLKLLLPLLDTTVALDPQFLPAYEYGAMILPAIDVDEAVRFVKKGVAHNPEAWRLYQHLGYIHWQHGDYAGASRAYSDGARIAGAPAWMRGMAARVEADGGNRATAREMYERIYAESDEAVIKEMAAKRLLWLHSLDERDAIRSVIAAVSARLGKCPDDWRAMTPELRAAGLRLNMDGAPLDPSDAPYLFKLAKCEVEPGARSGIIYK